MIEAVGQLEAFSSHGFLHQKQLILSCIDAFIDCKFVCFIFVKHLELGPGDPYQRIEPLEYSSYCIYHQIDGVPAFHVHLLVSQDSRIFNDVVLAQHYVSAPAERRDLTLYDPYSRIADSFRPGGTYHSAHPYI